ncbi:MAG: hypothetical protein ABI963_03240 [Rhizomicrobium sp.]
MAGKRAAQRGTMRGWVITAVLLILVLIGFSGAILRNGVLAAIGFLPILALFFWFKIKDDRRAARDPNYAMQRESERAQRRTKVEETRVSYERHASRKLINHVLWILGTLAIVLIVRGSRLYQHLNTTERKQLLYIVAAVALLAGVTVQIGLARWKARKVR